MTRFFLMYFPLNSWYCVWTAFISWKKQWLACFTRTNTLVHWKGKSKLCEKWNCSKRKKERGVVCAFLSGLQSDGRILDCNLERIIMIILYRFYVLWEIQSWLGIRGIGVEWPTWSTHFVTSRCEGSSQVRITYHVQVLHQTDTLTNAWDPAPLI